MCVATRGNDAETHARAKLAEAKDQGDEAAEILWSGVIMQLRHIREAQ